MRIAKINLNQERMSGRLPREESAGATMYAKILQWRRKNPLFLWRDANHISQDIAANMLDVSLSALRMWENGSNTPNQRNIYNLEKLIESGTVMEDWLSWLEARPQ